MLSWHLRVIHHLVKFPGWNALRVMFRDIFLGVCGENVQVERLDACAGLQVSACSGRN